MTDWLLGIALLVAASVPQGPPPPQIGLIKLASPSLDSLAQESSEGTLSSLVARRYVALQGSALKPEDFTPCLTEGSRTVRCIEQVLESRGARPGEIVLLVEPADDGFRWTCVGAPKRAFNSEHQIFQNIHHLPSDHGQSAVFSRASACLTYAGLQSGW